MKYSYHWLSELVKKIPPPSRLADLLTTHSFQVDEVKKVGRDSVFDIDILPNRMPDASGHIGIAREIHAITGGAVTIPPVTVRESNTPISRLLNAHVPSEGVERYILGMAIDITVKESPRFIQERLISCGFRPINNIVDATNYIMLETGHPAHAFDYDKLSGQTITVRYARPREGIETLDGTEYKLGSKHLIISDASGPLAIAGVKGGKRAEIYPGTKKVVLEVGVFDCTVVRQASRSLNLVTDASVRFSKGMPSAGLEVVMMRLLGLIQRVAGGESAGGTIDITKNMPKRMPIVVYQKHIASLLGKLVGENTVRDILARLNFKIEAQSKGAWKIIPPPYRLDITEEADVIEEIGRLIGYDTILPAAPHAALMHPEENKTHALSDALRESFKIFGFYEVQNYSFESRARETSRTRLELTNPLSDEFAFLRASLVPGLIKNIDANRHYSKDLRLFEIGNVFSRTRKEPEERPHASAALAGSGGAENLYFEAKGIAEGLCEQFGIADVSFEDIAAKAVPWPFTEKIMIHPYRAAFIKLDGTTIGALYQVHPAADITMPVVVIELLMPEFAGIIQEEFEFKPIPRFPAIVRDISVLVPREERADDVMEFMKNAGGVLLAGIDLFDYYEGEATGEDQKSLAFHLIFQAPNRTLKDKEISSSLGAIGKALAREGWEVRV